eukprot:5316079-Amphidinium_carterae.1
MTGSGIIKYSVQSSCHLSVHVEQAQTSRHTKALFKSMAVKAALIACAASVTLARAALCSSYDASSCSSMNDGGCSCYWDSTTCARNESDCSGMGPTSVGDCTLTGGQTVTFGWSGPDTGSN